MVLLGGYDYLLSGLAKKSMAAVKRIATGNASRNPKKPPLTTQLTNPASPNPVRPIRLPIYSGNKPQMQPARMAPNNTPDDLEALSIPTVSRL
jgi:hypothetical protein